MILLLWNREWYVYYINTRAPTTSEVELDRPNVDGMDKKFSFVFRRFIGRQKCPWSPPNSSAILTYKELCCWCNYVILPDTIYVFLCILHITRVHTTEIYNEEFLGIRCLDYNYVYSYTYIIHESGYGYIYMIVPYK